MNKIYNFTMHEATLRNRIRKIIEQLIYNFTMHEATPEQLAEGVVDLEETNRKELIRLLTFEELPSSDLLFDRAYMIMDLAKNLGADKVMIGGAPYLMSFLEYALESGRIEYVYAFSKRVSVDEKQSDGSIIKRTVFKHEGFI